MLMPRLLDKAVIFRDFVSAYKHRQTALRGQFETCHFNPELQ
ncbi:MAG: hypothetical protein WAL92_16235 [Thiogranum sp.]